MASGQTKPVRESADKQEILKAILDNYLEGIFAVDPEGKLTYANKWVLEKTEYSSNDLMGKEFSGFVSEEDRPQLLDLFKKTLAGKENPPTVLELIRKDGVKTLFEYEGLVLLSKGEKIGIQGILSETTEYAAAEEKDLTEEEKQFWELFSNSTDPMFILDRKGSFLAINRKITELTGYGVEHFKGGNLLTKALMAPASKRIIASKLAKRFIGGEFKPYTVEIVKKEGSKALVKINSSPIRFLGRKAELFILEDITERKKIERMQADLFESVSHELKTPITTIMTFADSLGKETAGPLTEEQKKIVSYITKDAVRLKQLVDKIMAFSQLDLGKKIVKCKIDIETLIDNAIQMFTPSALEKNIKIEKEVPAELPTVSCDIDRINDVLNNIIDNALRFTSEGTITVGAEYNDDEIVVRVSDTGVGIPEGELKKVFEKFYQVDQSISKVMGGTGLGLYVCQRIIEQHKGRIWVESKLGEGSDFYFTLPL